MNPYWDSGFFEFFQIFFCRLFERSTPLASDEIQFLVLGLNAISCGLVAPFLVLKRMVMFANSLSHTILFGILSAYLLSSQIFGAGWFDLSTLLIGALIAALITAFCTEGLVRLFRLQEDASIGLIFTSLFALGILLSTLYARDVHLGTEAVTGNVDALQRSDIVLSLQLLMVNLGVVALFYRPLQLICFDVGFARSLGVRSSLFHFLLLFLAALTCVGAFRSMGVLLVLAFLIGPYLIARNFCRTLPQLLFWCPVIGIGVALLGVALARSLLSNTGWALSTGGIVVCTMGLVYIVSQTNLFTWRRKIC
ncbi:MAG: metal ABC transporter permease [Chlamydiia bacterium]|nr:metal ABC transporter permease [Chlamydiia bacterium]